jgi:hypothetical protein
MKPTTSPSRIAANQQNAQKSTGPRTPEGKEVSKYNRLRHGLASPLIVLPFEDQNEYNNLYASFCEEYSPAGPTEESLVKQIADSQWKLRRLEKVENHVLAAMLDTPQTEPNVDPFSAMASALLGPGKHQQALNSLARYQSTLNRQFLQSVKELRRIQNERRCAEEEALKQAAIHEVLGITERSQQSLRALDLLAADPDAVTRYIDAETALLSARASATPAHDGERAA